MTQSKNFPEVGLLIMISSHLCSHFPDHWNEGYQNKMLHVCFLLTLKPKNTILNYFSNLKFNISFTRLNKDNGKSSVLSDNLIPSVLKLKEHCKVMLTYKLYELSDKLENGTHGTVVRCMDDAVEVYFGDILIQATVGRQFCWLHILCEEKIIILV